MVRKTYKSSLVLLIILFFVFSCKDTSEPIIVSTEDFHTAVDKVMEVMVHDIFSPPVASRVFVYPNIAAYEIIAQKRHALSLFKKIR